MQGPLYFAIKLLSIPLINSIVIKRDSADQIQPIGPVNFDSNFQISALSTQLNPEILSGATPDNGLTTPSSACLFNNFESTDPIQKRQLSSSGSRCPDDNQNEVSGPSAPNLISSGQATIAKQTQMEEVAPGENGGSGTITLPDLPAEEPPLIKPGSNQPLHPPAGFTPVGPNMGPLLAPGEIQIPAQFQKWFPNYDPNAPPEQSDDESWYEKEQVVKKNVELCPEFPFEFRQRPVCDSGSMLDMKSFMTKVQVDNKWVDVEDWILLNVMSLFTSRFIYVEWLAVVSCWNLAEVHIYRTEQGSSRKPSSMSYVTTP